MNLKMTAGGKIGNVMYNMIKKLLKNPEDFDFFQAVRLLEEYVTLENLHINNTYSLFENEYFRFKHNVSLAFPANEITKISKQNSRWEIHTNIMGLIGPTGVLHNHHTALIIERLQHKDSSLCDFLNIFQHRLVSFFYFSWKKNHFYADKQSKNAQILLSLMGQGTPSLQNRENIPDEVMLYYASYFSRRHPSVSGLEAVLTDYFKVQMRVKNYQKKWMRLSDKEQSQLSCCMNKQWEKKENKYNQLGVDAICGQRQLQYQYHFSLVAGPLEIEKFMSFLPDQKNFALVTSLIRRCAGIENTFDIKLVLSAKAVPYCKPGDVTSARLGWNTWLKSREFVSDADNTILYIRSWL